MKYKIYYTQSIRVKCKYSKTSNLIKLRLQIKKFLFWINTDFGVDVKEERNWPSISITSPMKLSKMSPYALEIYKKGTINLKNIADGLHRKYVIDETYKQEYCKIINQLKM